MGFKNRWQDLVRQRNYRHVMAARRRKPTNTISKQSFTAQLRPRIVSRSIRRVDNEGSVGYLAADELRSVDSAVSMMCRDRSITNATTRQSTVRWR
eukprot:scaffold173979_cov40-Cyclotella_meneghiniana.AAC.3